MTAFDFVVDFFGTIGHGGQADVYVVRRRDTGTMLAAKVLRESWDPHQRVAFQREAERQMRCAGPGVVPVHGYNFEATKPFILVELMRSGSLRTHLDDLLREGVVASPREALRVARDIAVSLDAVHRRGLAHCDLKPDNVLLDDNGRYVLNDFGVAESLGAHGVHRSASFAGTSAYAAPEHVYGTISPACDVYSLGVVLNEMLTGARLPRLWPLVPRAVRWPSSFHRDGEDLDSLVQALAAWDAQLRPTARGAVALIDEVRRRITAREVRSAARRAALESMSIPSNFRRLQQREAIRRLVRA